MGLCRWVVTGVFCGVGAQQPGAGLEPPNKILFVQELPPATNDQMLGMLFQQFPGERRHPHSALQPRHPCVSHRDELGLAPAPAAPPIRPRLAACCPSLHVVSA